MIQEEFRPILEELEAGRSAVLHRTADGVEYTRLFRPRERLILLGGGAAVIAIALVVIWLAVWLFIRMVIGWVRLLVRLGHRWCRKEIAA